MTTVFVDLTGQHVEQLSVDFTLTVRISGGFGVQTGQPFSLDAPDASLQLTPAPDLASEPLLALRALVGRGTGSVAIDDTGLLVLTLDLGDMLRMPASAGYESWTYWDAAGVRAVCTPGGDVAFWD